MALVTPLKRTAIIVRDMEQSLRFYRDVLGLQIWVQGDVGTSIPALYQLLGLPPCNVRWIILQSGKVDWGMVGLFELTDPAPADDTHPHIDRANRGEACLVFHSHDVQRVYERSREIGITILCPPTRLELPSLGVASLEMTLRDPNGVLVNLIQNLKGGSVGLSNRFPGLARRARAKSAGRSRKGATKRAAAPARTGKRKPKRKRAVRIRSRRSAASGRGRSG